MTAILLFQSCGMHRQDFFPVIRPIEVSATIILYPKVNANIIYISKKIPPPYFAAKYGNRQMLPRPTEAPAADKTNPSLPEKTASFFCFHVYSKLRPSFSIYNVIAQNFTPYRTSIHKNTLQCNAYLRIRYLFYHKLINCFTCIIIIMKSVHCGKYTAV